MAQKKNDRLIIGIGHKARQGKDTIADFLSKRYNCTIVHFADALYQECINAEILCTKNPPALYLKPMGEVHFNYPDPPKSIVNWIIREGEKKDNLAFNADYYYGGMQEKDGILLQFWGTEFRRKHFSWDYWVEIVKTILLDNPDTDFILPDVRFKNEAKMIKELGGTVWKVERTGYIAADRDPNHASEIELDSWPFDRLLINDATIEDLNIKANKLFRKVKGIE
jgi:hypothetical protein